MELIDWDFKIIKEGFKMGQGDLKGNSKKKKSNSLEKEEPCPVGACLQACAKYVWLSG